MTPIGRAAIRRCAGWSATERSGGLLPPSQMGSFETKWLTRPEKVTALSDFFQTVDRQGAHAALAEDHSAR